VIRQAAPVLALAVVLGHLPFLPSSLEDIDSVNFALGVRDFDVAQHRPHPPGYPVYIALAKAVVAAGNVVDRTDSQSQIEARSLAVLSLIGAMVAVVCLYRIFACFSPVGDDRMGRPWRHLDPRALAATALSVACPLFWYMSVRPMSDVPGLAAALASLVCLSLAWWRQQPSTQGDRRLEPGAIAASGRMIVLGSLLAAVAIGFRSQNAVLTLPFLLTAMIDRAGRGAAGALIGATVAFAVGCLLWAIPLIVASGGLNAYLAALGSQAGEDFAGVEMLYLNPSPRLAATALLRTLVYPWDSLVLGGIVLVLAAVGTAALVIREKRTFMALTMMAFPYFAFHLLFQDMDFVRYALPLIPAIAFLTVAGVELLARRAALPVIGALSLWSVVIAAPTLYAYSSEPSPVVRALAAMRMQASSDVTLASHQTFQRPLEAESVPIANRLGSPPRREWLELVRYWHGGRTGPVWFLADPRRTDLALIDPQSRLDRRDFIWHFSSLSQIGGMRPSAVEWYRLSPPGWFADEGWALTPETAGIARVTQRGPSVGPITAWVRRRPEAMRLLIGGRHLGPPTDPVATFMVSVDGKPLAKWNVRPGFFLQVFDVAPGALLGDGSLARLEVASEGVEGKRVSTAVEQFDLQPADVMMWGFDQGWYEAEYNPRAGLWRWTSDRAALKIVDASRPVQVRLPIESPRRYFDSAPTVRLTAGGTVLAEIHPDDDVVLDATVSPEVLRGVNGVLMVETDRVWVPAERNNSPDHRRLGLRVFAPTLTPRN
jgi:transmembrane protein TMEM260 (protein O-mannosyltransferase)